MREEMIKAARELLVELETNGDVLKDPIYRTNLERELCAVEKRDSAREAWLRILAGERLHTYKYIRTILDEMLLDLATPEGETYQKNVRWEECAGSVTMFEVFCTAPVICPRCFNTDADKITYVEKGEFRKMCAMVSNTLPTGRFSRTPLCQAYEEKEEEYLECQLCKTEWNGDMSKYGFVDG